MRAMKAPGCEADGDPAGDPLAGLAAGPDRVRLGPTLGEAAPIAAVPGGTGIVPLPPRPAEESSDLSPAPPVMLRPGGPEPPPEVPAPDAEDPDVPPLATSGE